MLEFLHAFVTWLHSQDLLPREVLDTDAMEDRNDKTFLMNLPEDVPNVFCVRQYNMKLSSLVAKDACVRYIQIIVRDQQQSQAIDKIEKVFQFLKDRPEYIEDMDDHYWVMIDCTNGPVKLDEDSQGRYLYSLSLPITTSA